MELGEKIKSLRLKKNMKQSDLAEKAKISRIAIGNYERGERQPNIEIVTKIAAALDVSVNELISSEELQNEIEQENAFIKYLECIHYTVKVCKVGESEAGYWEEHKNATDEIIGRSWIPNEEYFEVTLIKDSITTTYTLEEFKEFQQACEKSIDYQVWLKNNK